MRNLNNRAIAASSLLLMLLARSASAGGLYLWDFGQPTTGAAGAGAGAVAEDASTAFLNPAGIMFLEEPETLATGLVIDVSTKFRQDPSVSLTPPAVLGSKSA